MHLNKLKMIAVDKFEDNSVNIQVIQLVHAYEPTSMSVMIRRSFQKVGFWLAVISPLFTVEIIEPTLRENPGFQSGWERDIFLEALSRWKHV
jgi:hypothetical protein